MLDKWMLLTLFILIFSGYPVAFSLAGTAIIFGGIGIATGYMSWEFYMAMPQRIFGIMSNQILLAVPFFIFMGTVLEKSKIAEDLLKTVGQLFGPFRGGLAIAVVLVGALLAAATGVVGASVVAMGMISLPVMMKYGYSRSLIAGTITASGTLGQIIPPSLVLIVLGDQMGIPVGDLFSGALIPGILLALAYCIYVGLIALVSPGSAPALPLSERGLGFVDIGKNIIWVLLPPLFLILIVLGSIFMGLATPTEAGAFGAIGAIFLAWIKKQATKERMHESMRETFKITSMVIFLLIGATAFTLVFRGLDGDLWIQDMLTDLPGGELTLIIVTGLVIFFLGFFIDFFEIVFIVVPLLLPAAKVLGIDLTWYGIYIGMVLQTSFLTPPFGFSLFYLRGVAPPEMKTSEIYKGVVPFLLIQVIMIVTIVIFPELTRIF
jgi:tripartite ATP-independent transporter DctM subunit